MRIGLFTDAYYPMVDGVIKVVDSYARRLVDKCEVTVFVPAGASVNAASLSVTKA